MVLCWAAEDIHNISIQKYYLMYHIILLYGTSKTIIRVEVTLYWVDGVAVSEKEFLPIRAEFETMISQAITREALKIPLGGLLNMFN